MEVKAITGFNYAPDGRNVRRFEAGAAVPMLDQHIDRFVAEGKIEDPRPKVKPVRKTRRTAVSGEE